jgi:RHS repeat-associated protein
MPHMVMDSTFAYIYGRSNAPIEQVNLASGAVTYLISDRLGSVRATVNSVGSLTGTTSYDAWGNPQTPSGVTNNTPFGFAGDYTDPTGLNYNLHRYYDPQTGQFISVDPIVDETASPYGYASQDPVNNYDPSGMSAWKRVAAAPAGCPVAFTKDESGFHDWIRISFRASDLCRGHHVAIAAVHAYRTDWPPADLGWAWTPWARSPDDTRWYSVTQKLWNYPNHLQAETAHQDYQYLYWNGNWAFNWDPPWDFVNNTVDMPCYFGSYHRGLFRSKGIPACL